MRRLKPVVYTGSEAALGNRDRRKSYYHGKYAREVTSVVFVLAVLVFCYFRLIS